MHKKKKKGPNLEEKETKFLTKLHSVSAGIKCS